MANVTIVKLDFSVSQVPEYFCPAIHSLYSECVEEGIFGSINGLIHICTGEGNYYDNI